ncbi:MAG: hypothetical protein LV481_07180 [Methylacidiphilales bacterium]|nr:hypothetical protein [Candidatus Methylacidiphilales bacterium]
MATEIEPRSLTPAEEPRLAPAQKIPLPPSIGDSSLFEVYEHIVESRSGARDAQIFQKIREWCFSDFSLQPHEFAGVTKTEFDRWQSRHRINLSAGRILPDPHELQRGYAWGHIRIAASVNHLRSETPPPH